MSLRSMQKIVERMVLLFEKIFQYPRFHNMQKLPTEKNLEYTKGVFKLLGEILKPKMGMWKMHR